MLSYHLSPGGMLNGKLDLPGDKSISHRAAILAAIAEGTSRISNFCEGTDCQATLHALHQLGAKWRYENEELLIDGVGSKGFSPPLAPLNLANSGTGMRLLAGVLASQPFISELRGDESLSKRPMERIATPLRQMGAIVETTAGGAPLFIKGNARLKAIHYQLPVASAQLKSCILLAALYAEGKTTLHEPSQSRDHTENLLSAFSYEQFSVNKQQLTLVGQQKITAAHINVPNDISAAAFFIVCAIITPGSSIEIPAVSVNPTRIGVISILQSMGANITLDNLRFFNYELVADLKVLYSPLKAIHITPQQVPSAIDEFPILFIAAVYATGKTTVSGINELRYKESDRIFAMTQGLQRLGINVAVNNDVVEIEGGIVVGGEVESYGDHRVAMAFAIAAHNALNPVIIRDCNNVSTSFPNFVNTAQKIGLTIRAENSND